MSCGRMIRLFVRLSPPSPFLNIPVSHRASLLTWEWEGVGEEPNLAKFFTMAEPSLKVISRMQLSHRQKNLPHSRKTYKKSISRDLSVRLKMNFYFYF